MHHESKHTAADVADRDILRGPPGLLFGLTLLIFAAARLCFGWDAPSSPPKEVAAEAAPMQVADEAPLLTRADFTNQ